MQFNVLYVHFLTFVRIVCAAK